MSLRRHIAISRTYGANWLAESKALIESGLIMVGTKDMTRGVVKFFNAQKGYGFITREHQVGITERDIFVHISDLQRSGLTTLNPGQVVEYDLYEDHRGRPHVQKLKAV